MKVLIFADSGWLRWMMALVGMGRILTAPKKPSLDLLKRSSRAGSLYCPDPTARIDLNLNFKLTRTHRYQGPQLKYKYYSDHLMEEVTTSLENFQSFLKLDEDLMISSPQLETTVTVNKLQWGRTQGRKNHRRYNNAPRVIWLVHDE